MKIPEENFLELINSYLDNEASPQELEAISKLIAEDETFAAMFCEYRSIYIATAKHYSRSIKLQALPKHKAKRPSVFRGNLEWCAVIVLMIICGFLAKEEITSSSEQYIRNLADKPAFADQSFSVKVKDFFEEAYSFYSLLEFNKE